MPQVLSQTEIDALLSTLKEDKEQTAGPQIPERTVHLYDFRNPEHLSKDQLRILKMIHDGCARSVSNSLSIALRLMVDVKVISVDQLSYSEFTMLLTEPSCLYLIEMQGLNSHALISLAPSLVYFVIDRQLGGKGEVFMESRELTAIEESIVSKIVNRTLAFLEEAWEPVVPLKLKRGSFESNPKTVQIAAPSAPVLVISFEVRIRDFVGTFTFCYPYFALEQLVQNFHSPTRITYRQQTATEEIRERILANVRYTKLLVSVTLAEVQMTMYEIASLEVGDIIRTDQAMSKPLCVKIDGRPKWHAHPGLIGKKVGVKIVGVIANETVQLKSSNA